MQRKALRHVSPQQTPTVVPLVEEEPIGVSLPEAELEPDPVLEDLEPLRGLDPGEQTGRGLLGRQGANLTAPALAIHPLHPGQEILGHRGSRRILGQHQGPVAQPFDVASRTGIRGPMHHPVGRGLGWIDEALPELSRRRRPEVGLRLEDRLRVGGGVADLEPRGVQVKPSGGRAPIQHIPEQRRSLAGGMDPDLMGPPRHGLRLQPGQPALASDDPEPGLGPIPMVARPHGGVAVPDPFETISDHEDVARHRSVGRADVSLVGLSTRELFREGTVREGRLPEHQDPAGLLVEPMDDRQRGPAGFPVPQPVVDPLPRMGRRRMRVPARRLVHHEEMLVLVDHTGRRSWGIDREHGGGGGDWIGGPFGRFSGPTARSPSRDRRRCGASPRGPPSGPVPSGPCWSPGRSTRTGPRDAAPGAPSGEPGR